MRKLALALSCSAAAAILIVACGPQPDPVVAPGPRPLVAPVPPSPVASATASIEMPATAAPTQSSAPVAPPACGAGMMLVPGGSFTWGVKKETTKIDPFCMDGTETTADQYAACVKDKKCTEDFLKCAPQQTYGVAGKGNFPVVCVDVTQATAYCKAQNKRLPKEEEWEWAARGEDKGSVYPWGDDKPKDQLCWSGGGTQQKGPCEVGTFPKGDNPQGIHDLAGNVFEWTTSRNDATSPNRDGRGGSWKDGTPELVKANRPGAFAPTYRCGFLGIRCVTEAPAGAK